MSAIISPVVLVHEHDNVLIARRNISAGDIADIDGVSVRFGQNVPVGHKVARMALSTGQKVVRFGAPIGSMTAEVGIGGHIHTHNMKSDYIASHDRGAVALDGGSK